MDSLGCWLPFLLEVLILFIVFNGPINIIGMHGTVPVSPEASHVWHSFMHVAKFWVLRVLRAPRRRRCGRWRALRQWA